MNVYQENPKVPHRRARVPKHNLFALTLTDAKPSNTISRGRIGVGSQLAKNSAVDDGSEIGTETYQKSKLRSEGSENLMLRIEIVMAASFLDDGVIVVFDLVDRSLFTQWKG